MISCGSVTPPSGCDGRQSARSTIAILHTSTNLPPDDVVAVGSIPTASVARTIFGLAGLVPATLSFDRFGGIVSEAVRDGKASDAWLWSRLEQLRCRGRNGVSTMEAVLVDRSGFGRTESWLEREFLRVLADGGLPLPVCQQRIDQKGAFTTRVDFLFTEDRLVVEVDGHGTHSTREERRCDAERANRLILRGFRVLRFTYEDVTRRPEIVQAMVRRALVQAA